MDIRQLEYFVAVAEELHFGRAASRIGMTQPPLSQQIRQLETDMGVRLFERTNRRVALTDAGRVFLADAHRILQDLKLAEERARQAQSGVIGRLALGFVGSATYGILPPIIRRYQESFPGIDLALQEMSTPIQLDALLAGHLDVGFVRPTVANPEILMRVIHRERCVAVVPAIHALAGNEHIRIEQLKGEPFVVVARTVWPGLYDSILTLSRSAGFSPLVRLEVSEVQTVVGLVGAGLGVTLLPNSVQHVHTRDVRYLPIVGECPVVEMAIAWRHADKSSVVNGFLDVTRGIADSMAEPDDRG